MDRHCKGVSGFQNIYAHRANFFSSLFGKIQREREKFFREQFANYEAAYIVLSDWATSALEAIARIDPEYKAGNLKRVRLEEFESIRRDLHVGGWCLFFTNSALQPKKYPDNWFSPHEIGLFCRSNGICLGISSHYDNVEWLIFEYPVDSLE